MRTIPICDARSETAAPIGEALKLSELPRRVAATVESVEDQAPNDAIARRLRELGFVKGERVEVMASGPISAEPLLIQIGYTRFALRRSEAARIQVQPEAGGSDT
ncbi:ferrous iron transport protein A [Lysobacter sp. cf310]|nr:ferrous iron transport protein A [Lysobacter sp. cf310]